MKVQTKGRLVNFPRQLHRHLFSARFNFVLGRSSNVHTHTFHIPQDCSARLFVVAEQTLGVDNLTVRRQKRRESSTRLTVTVHS